MSVTLDKQVLFDAQQLAIDVGSFNRASVERMVPGLDGVLSVDLGGRGRKIKQKGTLRAKSRAQLQTRINAISAYMDGKTHTLATGTDEEFNDVRIDSFKVNGERASGADMVVDYEIVYTQLQV
jgi:hypothetical protein